MLLIVLLYLQCPISWEQSVLILYTGKRKKKKEIIIKNSHYFDDKTLNPDGTTVDFLFYARTLFRYSTDLHRI